MAAKKKEEGLKQPYKTVHVPISIHQQIRDEAVEASKSEGRDVTFRDVAREKLSVPYKTIKKIK